MAKRQEIEVPSRSIIDDMRPDVPPEDTSQGRKEDTEAAGGDALQQETVQTQDTPRRKPKAERDERKTKSTGNTPEEDAYLESFIETPPMAMIARNGKLAYLTPRNHQRIQKVISVIGHNQVNIATYLNRIVSDHFDRNDVVIKSLLEKGYSEEF